MKRPLACVAASSALLLSLHACSSDGGAASDGDGRSSSGDGGSSDGDGGSSDGALADGQTRVDGGSDGALGDAAIDAPVDAGPPAVRFMGRFDQAPAAGPKVSYPGASITARFMGTEVKAKFEDIALFNPPYGANRWEAVVDGVSTATIQLDRMQATTYTLAAGLANGAHTVELHKLTEASVGTSQFEGFDFPGGALLPPPLPANRHLQFLGDSSANGYGVDGAAGCTFSAATENERRSFPALVAHDLLADHHNLGASGKGIFQNYARPGDTDVFAVIYQLTNVTSFYAGIAQPVWDSTKYTQDVVWITLGGNDYDHSSMAVDPAPPTSFLAKYQQLVSTIRTQHPLHHPHAAPARVRLLRGGAVAQRHVPRGLQCLLEREGRRAGRRRSACQRRRHEGLLLRFHALGKRRHDRVRRPRQRREAPRHGRRGDRRHQARTGW